MELINLSLATLIEAPWNPNYLDHEMLARLKESVLQFGLVGNLVVRPIGDDCYEVLSGNQRLRVLSELGYSSVPCVVKELDDARARLLAQALNRIQGQDDLGLKAELVRVLLKSLPQEEVLALLPETAGSLMALASLGQETLAEQLGKWQQAQEIKLKTLTFPLAPAQLEVVERALARFLPRAQEASNGSPNLRATALYLLCERQLGAEEYS